MFQRVMLIFYLEEEAPRSVIFLPEAKLHYGGPGGSLGLCTILPVLIHIHVEYDRTGQMFKYSGNWPVLSCVEVITETVVSGIPFYMAGSFSNNSGGQYS